MFSAQGVLNQDGRINAEDFNQIKVIQVKACSRYFQIISKMLSDTIWSSYGEWNQAGGGQQKHCGQIPDRFMSLDPKQTVK